MAALHARQPKTEAAPAAAPASSAPPASGAPWSAVDGAGPGQSAARDMQSQLKADVYAGRLETTDRPAPYAPARGVAVALVPSLLLWWGVVSALHALTHTH